jgi:hypothetical protein
MKRSKILIWTMLFSILCPALACNRKNQPEAFEPKPVSETPLKVRLSGPMGKLHRGKTLHPTATVTNTSDEVFDYVDWSCSWTSNWPTNTVYIHAEPKYCHKNMRSFGSLAAGETRQKQLEYSVGVAAPDRLLFQVGYRSGTDKDPNTYWSNPVEVEIGD